MLEIAPCYLMKYKIKEVYKDIEDLKLNLWHITEKEYIMLQKIESMLNKIRIEILFKKLNYL
jgi:hypothetical protein